MALHKKCYANLGSEGKIINRGEMYELKCYYAYIINIFYTHMNADILL